jgi:DNA-binding transcriptional LysR family regulator
MQLEQRLLDCAVVREERVQPGMERRILGTVGYRLFVPAQMVSDRSLETLLEKLPIAMAQGGRFRDAVELGSRESGLAWSPSLECSSHTLSAAAVATGTYAAILPSMARTAFAHASVKDFPLPATWRLDRNLALAWLPGGERLQLDLAEILALGL